MLPIFITISHSNQNTDLTYDSTFNNTFTKDMYFCYTITTIIYILAMHKMIKHRK